MRDVRVHLRLGANGIGSLPAVRTEAAGDAATLPNGCFTRQAHHLEPQRPIDNAAVDLVSHF